MGTLRNSPPHRWLRKISFYYSILVSNSPPHRLSTPEKPKRSKISNNLC
ncbi:hypothetical protein BAZOLSSOX_2058 [uncultured Gammaproteobacteria bacterium]|nr:hypothetical protein BAZOLSSOX_2058 [uncultured Gammaproteobacteria bacterium]